MASGGQSVNARAAVRFLQTGLHFGPPKNEETYKQHLQWKNIVIGDALQAANKSLKKGCPKLRECTNEFIFKIDYIHGCPLDVTYADRYLAYSGVDKKTGEWSLEYISLGGGEKFQLNPTSVLAQPIKVLQEFIQQYDKPLYDPRTKEGFWYSIFARSNHVGKAMILITIHTETEEEAIRECDSLAAQLLTLYEGAETEIVSLVLKATYDQSGEYIKIVLGDEYIIDEAAGLKFQMYPKTFFWSNHFGAETLCKTLAEVLQLDENSAVIDVGCSNGMIGMYLSKFCSKVFMLERKESYLKHAQQNALLNGINKCEFLENRLHKNVNFQNKLAPYDNVAAILNDDFNARNAVDARAIRELKTVNKLVYISKVNKDSDRNLVTLCGNKGKGGIPFVPVRAIPVDMNPGLIQVEVVFLLERPKVKIESAEEKAILDKKNSEFLQKSNIKHPTPSKTNQNNAPSKRNHSNPPSKTNYNNPPSKTNYNNPPSKTNYNNPPSKTNYNNPPLSKTNNYAAPSNINYNYPPPQTNYNFPPPPKANDNLTNYNYPPPKINYNYPPPKINYNHPPPPKTNDNYPPPPKVNYNYPPPSRNLEFGESKSREDNWDGGAKRSRFESQWDDEQGGGNYNKASCFQRSYPGGRKESAFDEGADKVSGISIRKFEYVEYGERSPGKSFGERSGDNFRGIHEKEFVRESSDSSFGGRSQSSGFHEARSSGEFDRRDSYGRGSSGDFDRRDSYGRSSSGDFDRRDSYGRGSSKDFDRRDSYGRGFGNVSSYNRVPGGHDFIGAGVERRGDGGGGWPRK